jgi:Zn-dependent peptidase ImmA (M78 family)/transcriptional regulator with XRE-family HTH domain
MKRIEGAFSGARLRVAREFQGLTGAQLAEQVSVSQPFLSKLEGGEKVPGDILLSALSETLGFDGAFFFSPPFEEFKDGECHFRSRKTTPLKVKRRALAHGSLFGMLVSYFDARVGLPKRSIPHYPQGASLDLAGLADQCRDHWGLGSDVPITNMTRVLENAGAVVTRFTGQNAKVDAFSRTGQRDVIVLNTLKGSSHSRWDLGHELGHIVMHRGLICGPDDFEKQADKFAAEFLLPRRALEREFRPRRLDWGMLFDLKQRWKTSASALVRRAHELGLLSSSDYRRAYKYYHAKRWHEGEPYESVAEEPEIVPTALRVLEIKKGESPLEIARKLHWQPHIMEEVLGWELPRPQGPLAQVASLDQFRLARRTDKRVESEG